MEGEAAVGGAVEGAQADAPVIGVEEAGTLVAALRGAVRMGEMAEKAPLPF